jgi:hypothetical protein
MRRWTPLSMIIMLIAGLFVFNVVPCYAADDYWLQTGTLRDSTYITPGDEHYTVFLHDSATFHVENGDTLIDLGQTYYNFFIKSLNVPGDSGYAYISFSKTGGKGIWHADSVARNMIRATVGLNSADDQFISPIGSRYIWIRPVKGGTADSTVTLDIDAKR